MSEALSFAIGIVQNVLAAPGIRAKTPKGTPAPKPQHAKAPSLTAQPNAPGKAVQPQSLNTAKVHAAAAAAMKPFLQKLTEAGLGSPQLILDAAADAIKRLKADGTTKITMNAWLGTILEIEGPKHPVVKNLSDDLSAASIRFANDAIAGNRPVFIDGIGGVKTLPKRLKATDMKEIHDLRIGAVKYCDRALQITDSSGNMFIVLTQEFKTGGNKRRAIDEQQNARNVRLIDDKHEPLGIKLSYFQGGKKMRSVGMAKVVVHLENTESQIGIKASTKNALVPRTQKKTGKNQYLASYYYQKIKWPSREVRFVLQKVWNKL